MYKLQRFFNQNRKKILWVILIIVFLFGVQQFFNYLAKNDYGRNKNVNSEIQNSNTVIKQEVTTNKSVVSGGSISTSKLKNDTDIIDEFFKACNSSDLNLAYNLLSEECKEVMFPTLQDFNNIYYKGIFNTKSKKYSVENWIGDTYKVTITDNIIATGKVDDSTNKQDYITIVEQNDEYKLNINNYIGRKIKNSTTENNNIKITVNSIDTYMDYEIYNLSIENNSKSKILLDSTENSNSVYISDSRDIKYYFYNNEMYENELMVENGYKKSVKIKFMSTYSSNKEIKNIVFSKAILNYNQYSNLENKEEFADYEKIVVEI